MNPQNAAKAVRAHFEAHTSLRTYSIAAWRMDREDVFDADVPWRDRDEAPLAEWLEKTGMVVTERRNTRMTIGFPKQD